MVSKKKIRLKLTEKFKYTTNKEIYSLSFSRLRSLLLNSILFIPNSIQSNHDTHARLNVLLHLMIFSFLFNAQNLRISTDFTYRINFRFSTFSCLLYLMENDYAAYRGCSESCGKKKLAYGYKQRWI